MTRICDRAGGRLLRSWRCRRHPPGGAPVVVHVLGAAGTSPRSAVASRSRCGLRRSSISPSFAIASTSSGVHPTHVEGVTGDQRDQLPAVRLVRAALPERVRRPGATADRMAPLGWRRVRMALVSMARGCCRRLMRIVSSLSSGSCVDAAARPAVDDGARARRPTIDAHGVGTRGSRAFGPLLRVYGRCRPDGLVMTARAAGSAPRRGLRFHAAPPAARPSTRSSCSADSGGCSRGRASSTSSGPFAGAAGSGTGFWRVDLLLRHAPRRVAVKRRKAGRREPVLRRRRAGAATAGDLPATSTVGQPRRRPVWSCSRWQRRAAPPPRGVRRARPRRHRLRRTRHAADAVLGTTRKTFFRTAVSSRVRRVRTSTGATRACSCEYRAESDAEVLRAAHKEAQTASTPLLRRTEAERKNLRYERGPRAGRGSSPPL